jgi:hypothetical protein
MDIKIIATPQTELRMKGDILLCDPCYFFPSERPGFHEAWQELVRQMFPGGKSGELTNSGVVKITTPMQEFEFIYVSTKYGDGVFGLNILSTGAQTLGREIGVDAGLICAVKASDAKSFAVEFVPEHNGIVIQGFDGEVAVDGDNGTLYGSGNMEFLVDTGETEEEDEWDDEEEDYEED